MINLLTIMNKNFITRKEIEEKEQSQLAPYACLSSESKGRKYLQEEHDLRTAFQRDRDRIIHSTAFRRLEYKTQVFIPHERDHFRTRLTHTIEVAQISRTIARNLRLNEDLSEAVALSHDLGHTPFGHSGEDVLNHLLKDRGGFNHNRQSLRVVDLLEQRDSSHQGLNLSYEVREGIIKHATGTKIVTEEFDPQTNPTLEASLVDMVDEIAYNSHDIDDGLSSGIISISQIQAAGIFDIIESSELKKIDSNDPFARQKLARTLIDVVVRDLIENSSQAILDNDIKSLDDVRNCQLPLIKFSDNVFQFVAELKKFLNDQLYKNSKMVSMTEWAGEIITHLYQKINSDTSLMPERFQKMLGSEKQEIVIADYIAGMTDRYATNMYDN